METAEESEEVDDNNEVEAEQPAPSYLPTWVLRMREKIASSRLAHADAESRIEELHKGVDVLNVQLSKMEKAKQQRLNKTRAIRTEQEKTSEVSAPRVPAIYSVPIEVLSNILEHLRLEQVVRLELVCKTLRSMLSGCSYWPQVLPLYCPHLVLHGDHAHSEADEQATAKQRIQQYLRNVKTCVSFIQTMKDQRCVPKHRSVQPHRHTRQERQVTHPLPVFQHSQSMHAGTGAGSTLPALMNSTRANSARNEDLIMSHAETLSSDFRSIAHKALSTLLFLSSDITDPFFYKLLSEGAVTVLTSLLTNEEGALQNYACSILANLLCWEARKIQAHKREAKSTMGAAAAPGKRSNSALAPSPQELACLRAVFGMTHEALSQTMSVGLQVSACGGLKLLTSLLTSPTAAINISHHSSSTHRSAGSAGSAGGAMGEAGAGQPRALRGTTSSIQGMCNKQASRALITLVYPQMPVPLAVVSKVSATITAANLSPTSSPVRAGHSELTLQDVDSPQKKESGAEAKGVVPEHLRSPAVSDLFLTDTSARPWQFSYFYKSGAVKDQFTAYLRFRSSGGSGASGGSGGSAGATLRGRGVDDIGAFTLTGRAEADISGWSWYINKSYVPFAVDQATDANQAGDLQDDAVNATDEELGVEGGNGALTRMERWLQDVEGLLDPPNALATSARAGGSSVHVTHVAYWCTGVEDEQRAELRQGNRGAKVQPADAVEPSVQTVGTATAAPASAAAASESELDFVDESPSGVWGVGLWGVWETSSGTGAHFELQKGGVFRAAPMALLSAS